MTTSSHADCYHAKTKAARAKCRKLRAVQAEAMRQIEIEQQAFYEAYIRPREIQDAAQKAWDDACEGLDQRLIDAASGNADDTSVELGFEVFSTTWYKTALDTLETVKGNAHYYLEEE